MLAPAVCSQQRPTALRPCVVPRRSSAVLSSLLVTAGTPNRLQTVLQLASVVFVLLLCFSCGLCDIWFNPVSVFIHPMANFSSVLSAAKEPRLRFCCGGVVREPLVSVREKFASICNYMQGLRLWRNNGETMAKQWRNKFATAGFSRGATADDTWLLASVFVNTTWPLRLNALEVCGSA